MTEAGKSFALFVLVGLMALPSGLCSTFFTLGGIGMLFERDPLGQGLAVVFLGGALIGWLFCAVVLLGARRIRRAPAAPVDPTDGEPPGVDRPV